MAYDRFDPRYDRPERSRTGSDRWPGERWGGDPRNERDRYSRDDRGFFERAGDEIASWFGDDDAERRRERDERDRWSERGRDWQPRGQDRSRYAYGARDEFGPRAFGPSSDFDRGVRDYSRRSPGEDRFAQGRGGRNSDPHYTSWRDRHLDELDRDYDEYRRENQSRFESEFGSWRAQRLEKRKLMGSVREHMEVVGSDDAHVGTVDRVEGDRIVLTKSDEDSAGRHHYISCRNVDRVEQDRVILDCSADQAKKIWESDTSTSPFVREERGEDGPHILERSFEGTYR